MPHHRPDGPVRNHETTCVIATCFRARTGVLCLFEPTRNPRIRVQDAHAWVSNTTTLPQQPTSSRGPVARESTRRSSPGEWDPRDHGSADSPAQQAPDNSVPEGFALPDRGLSRRILL